MQCSDCHKLHKQETISQDIEDQLSRCVSCHPNQDLEFKYPYIHPLRERQIKCSDCHNPHSWRHKGMLKKEGDKACGACHADIMIKAGKHPESKNTNHPSGVVECMDCHNPHGSNFNKVLRHSLDRICKTCHN
jgi:predicted CXXCH cytochrome family protein